MVSKTVNNQQNKKLHLKKKFPDYREFKSTYSNRSFFDRGIQNRA